MANDKDIKIGLKTVGADAAVSEISKVPEALEKVPDTTAPAGEGIDDLKEKLEALKQEARALSDQSSDTTGELEKLPDAMDEAGESARRMDENIQRITRAQTAQVIGQLSGQLAGFGTKFRDAAVDVAAFDQELARTLENAAENIEGVSSSVSTLAFAFAAGGPLGAAFAGFGLMLSKTAEAWVQMRTAQAEAAAANETYAQRLEYMRTQQAKLSEQIRKDFVAGVYKKEADELARQVAAIERINQLRGELQNIEQQRANRQIDIARDSGGDVALAEANALAVKLRTGLDAINGELAAAQARVTEAERVAEQNRIQYERAVRDAESPEALKQLSAAADQAAADAATAAQQYQDTAQVAAAQRVNFLEQIQEEYRGKFSEYQPQINSAADRAFDEVYKGVQSALTSGPQAAISKIAVDVQQITTVANQQVAKSQQDTQTIVRTVQDVGKGVDELGNAVIAALATVSVGIGQVLNRIAGQQRQIEQLFARIR